MPTLEEQNKTHGASNGESSNPPDPPSRNSSNSSIANNGVVDTNTTTASSSSIPSKSKPPLPTTSTNSPENNLATAGNTTQNNDDGKLIINHEHSDSLVHLLPTNLLDDSPTMSEADPEEESPQLAAGNTSENGSENNNMRDSINNNKEELAGESIDFDDDMAAAINNSSPPPTEEGDTTSLSLSPGHDTVLQYSPTRTSDYMMNTSYDVALQNGRVSPDVSKLQHPLHQKQPTGTHITEKQLALACAAKKQANNNQMTTLLDVLQEQRQQHTPSPENNATSRRTVQQQLQQVKLSPIPSENTTPSSAIRYLHTQTPANTPLHQPQIPQQQVQSLHPGRRSITLRLLEEIPPNRPRLGSGGRMSSPLLSSITNTPFKSLRRFRSLSLTSSGFVNATPNASTSGDSLDGMGDTATTDISEVDRGTIVVSWYEGTTSSEMTEHVFNCVLRKLNSSDSSAISSVPIGGSKKKGGKIKLEDVRLLDDQEEVVLCPFLPDGSSFLLKFKIAFERPATPPRNRLPPPYASEAPDSPSAEPSPHPSSADLPSLSNKVSDQQRQYLMQQNQIVQQQNNKLEQQNEQQMQMLSAVAALLQQQQSGGGLPPHLNLNSLLPNLPPLPEMPSAAPQQASTSPKEQKKDDEPHTPVKNRLMPPTMAPISENSTTDQAIEHQLRQLNELFIQRRSSSVVTQSNEDTAKAMNADENMVRAYHRDEKKQVIFVIANYLVLFMAMIAMSAEIQSRLPRWMEWVQQNYDSVQNCATDQAALMECLARGDLSGLIASFVLWATQSVFAQRIFLFGFDTPKKLWTVVYEALVTAVCWGISYLFIRRGLNPNTRQNFVHKYWKDAVYGSLAGFNAAFMKAVLKNLVPQDVALEALEGRQLRIFHWLGSFLTTEGLE